MQRWVRIRTDSVMEWPDREIRRRTGIVGIFPDGASTLMSATAWLKHIVDVE